MTFLMVLLVLGFVALAVLAAWAFRLQAEVRALRLRAEALALVPPVLPELSELARAGAATLSIQILNGAELATQKHWAAGAMARLSPGIVRHFVGREAARILALELPKYGVVAEVRVIGGA